MGGVTGITNSTIVLAANTDAQQANSRSSTGNFSASDYAAEYCGIPDHVEDIMEKMSPTEIDIMIDLFREDGKNRQADFVECYSDKLQDISRAPAKTAAAASPSTPTNSWPSMNNLAAEKSNQVLFDFAMHLSRTGQSDKAEIVLEHLQNRSNATQQSGLRFE